MNATTKSETPPHNFFEKFRAEEGHDDFNFERIGREVGLGEALEIAQEITQSMTTDCDEDFEHDLRMIEAELGRRIREINGFQSHEEEWRLGVADLKAGRTVGGIVPNRYEYHLSLARKSGNASECDQEAVDSTTGERVVRRYGQEIAAYASHVDEIECAENDDRLFVEVGRDASRVVPIDLQDKVARGGDFTVEDVGILELAGWSKSDIEKLVGVETLCVILAKKINHDETWSLDDLLAGDSNDNSEAVFASLGNLGGAFIVSDPGIGKSSLVVQCAIGLACNRPEVSLNMKSHVGPLRQLVIQAENNKEATRAAVTGVIDHFGLTPDEKHLLRENVQWKRWSGLNCRGLAFLERLERTIEEFEPRVVWVDPLFSFFEGSLKDEDRCTEFFYGNVNDILARTGTSVVFVHHAPKASHSGRRARGCERTHHGFGSAVLGAWAREIFVLEERHGKGFPRKSATLAATKQLQGQAGFRSFEGDKPVDEIVIQHGEGGVYWEQRSDPQQEKRAAKNLPENQKREKIVGFYVEAFDAIRKERGGDVVPKRELEARVLARVKNEHGFTQSEAKGEAVQRALGIHDTLLNEEPPSECLFRVRDANGNGSGTRLVERAESS